jgi:hypothetical protein
VNPHYALLLLQVRFQEANNIVVAKLFRPRNERYVARNLVVLDRLRDAAPFNPFGSQRTTASGIW